MWNEMGFSGLEKERGMSGAYELHLTCVLFIDLASWFLA